VRVHLLDVEFDALTVEGLNIVISEAVDARICKIIANHNLHSIYLFHTDPEMRQFFRTADKIHIDGMPLICLARLFEYPVRREHRVTYLDWIWALMSESERRSWRVFYLGGKPGVAAQAAQRLRLIYPGLELETHHGYFTKTGQENNQILERIRSFKPNILMVGMGMPLQEQWILENRNEVEANVILTAGACFDYVAGVVPFPPRWMGQLGLEWLFRLGSEPGRLWKRYLVEPWYILGLVLKEILNRTLGRK
jgi:N-acetylglucosaminyldiphosphoundecaprenol N-acetyl-beta-D-mannosaminyltransferase